MPRSRAWLLTLVATFTMSVSYFDRQTLAAIAPFVTAALGLNEAQYGLLGSAFAAAYLVGTPAAGWLLDRMGARHGLLAAVLAWSVVAALHAVAPGFGALLALRVLLGFAEAPSFPGAAQTVHRVLPAHERARGVGVLFTGSSIGAMVAAPVAVALAARHGFRAAFVVTACAGLVWVPLWLAVAFRPDARAVLDAQKEPEGPAPRSGPREVLALARHPAVLRAVAGVLAAAPVIGFIQTWGAKYLVRDQHVVRAATGHYLWLPPLLFDLGAVFFGDLAARRATSLRGSAQPDRALVAAAVALEAGVALLPLARSPWEAVAVLSLAMAGGGGLYALYTHDMIVRVPAGAVAAASGLTATAQSIAHIVLHPLVGHAVDAAGSYRGVTLALAVWLLPGCLVWWLWPAPPLAPGEVR